MSGARHSALFVVLKRKRGVWCGTVLGDEGAELKVRARNPAAAFRALAEVSRKASRFGEWRRLLRG